MPNRVPLHKAVETDFEMCCQHVDRLRALKKSDVEAYEREKKELVAIASGKLARTSDRVSQEMAETILNELGVYSHIIRPEVAEVLRSNPDPEFSPKSNRFMGSKRFIPIEEAERSGEIPEGYL